MHIIVKIIAFLGKTKPLFTPRLDCGCWEGMSGVTQDANVRELLFYKAALDTGSSPFHARITVDSSTVSNLASPPCYAACQSTYPVKFYRSVIWIPKPFIKPYILSVSTTAWYLNVLCSDIYQENAAILAGYHIRLPVHSKLAHAGN
jgi:hypothetical protein